MINYTHPFMVRRQLLGLSLIDVQSHLSRQGFTFSVETLAAFEHGERRFPVENPGFLVAMSQCLEIPAVHAWQTARQATNALQAQHQFWNKVQQLRPQNQFLLRWVLRHPGLSSIPGFDTLFEIAKWIALKLPDRWFITRW